MGGRRVINLLDYFCRQLSCYKNILRKWKSCPCFSCCGFFSRVFGGYLHWTGELLFWTWLMVGYFSSENAPEDVLDVFRCWGRGRKLFCIYENAFSNLWKGIGINQTLQPSWGWCRAHAPGWIENIVTTCRKLSTYWFKIFYELFMRFIPLYHETRASCWR